MKSKVMKKQRGTQGYNGPPSRQQDQPREPSKMLPSSSNNGHLFSASWIDGVREQAAARGDAGEVERMDRMSREVNRRDADADRMLVHAEALAAAEESEHETRKEVEQAESRARVAMRAKPTPTQTRGARVPTPSELSYGQKRK